MITRKLQLLVLLFMIGISTSLTAQKIIKKANKQFELRAYDKAYSTYIKALEKYPDNNVVKLQIAECLRRTNKILESREWYENAMKNPDVPMVYNLTYGHLLKSVADYEKAIISYEKYKTVDSDLAEHYMLSCDFALNLMREQSDYELMLDDCNSAQSDLSAKFYGDDMVFTSFRDTDKEAKIEGCKLYIKKEGVESKALRSPLKSQYGIGFITYAIDDELCAYTTSNVKNNHEPVSEKDEDHAIHFGQVIDGGDFIEGEPFRFNEVTSSTAFPHLAFDGSALYFSSNRQGGYGGYDLYVSYNKGGEWTAPENLGPTINSVGNEITPFFDDVNLYFASNFHAGMGGYDLFQSDVVMGEWTYPLNMGNGINSPGDDYYPAIKRGDDTFYFSSNRLGGRGGDDIYFGIPTQEEVLYSVNEIYNDVEVPTAIKLMNDYIPSSIQMSPEETQSMVQLVAADEVTNIKILNSDNKVVQDRALVTTTTLPTVSSEVLSIVGEQDAAEIPQVIAIEDQVETAEDAKTIVNTDVSIAPIVHTEIHTTEINNLSNDRADVETTTIPMEVKDVIVVKTESDPAEEIVVLEETLTNVQAEKPSAKKLITEVPGSRSITADINMAGAKRVSYGDLLPTVGTAYFIQLASLSRSKGNVNDYKSLIKYGNIYKMYRQYSTKIKLGYFTDKSEAKRVLRNVKAQGFTDAFVTSEPLNTGEMELFIAGKEYDYDANVYSSQISQGTKYKVRLASYEDPIWFDIKSAKKLGEIEQWTKGGWTIFILSGFQDMEEAHAAKIRAINRGFADAEVVIDNGGILERIKTN